MMEPKRNNLGAQGRVLRQQSIYGFGKNGKNGSRCCNKGLCQLKFSQHSFSPPVAKSPVLFLAIELQHLTQLFWRSAVLQSP